MSNITIGTDNFRELVSYDGINSDKSKLFVDKTMFIHEFNENKGKVILINRPRRWGKTTNLSMLQHFFAKTVDGQETAHLFTNLKISECSSCMKKQGKNPVIFVRFKDLTGNNFEEIIEELQDIISILFERHDYLLDALSSREIFSGQSEETYTKYQNKFKRLLTNTSTKTDLRGSLAFLSELLATFHKRKCYIFVDEYDNAMNTALIENPKILRPLTKFFSGLFGAAFKGNSSLKKGLITGILRLAKANIFSGLNNLREYSILDDRFSSHYGFTEVEVNELLDKSKIKNKAAIKKWYYGYTISNKKMYNPWSISNCIDNNGLTEAYWVATANQGLIKEVLVNRSNIEDKEKLRSLLQNNSVTLSSPLEKLLTLDSLKFDSRALWSFLVHTGYLTTSKNKKELMLPNLEMKQLVKKHIDEWFSANTGMNKAANYILLGDIIGFLDEISEELANPAYAARIFSGGGRASRSKNVIKFKEFIYHFLLMTQLRCINTKDDNYKILAEAQTGIGKSRADFMVVNKKLKTCIVGELKVSADSRKLPHDADKALAQINQKRYGLEQETKGYKLVKLGISFRGKKLAAAYQINSDEVCKYP